jgi:hypothetical protein
MNLASFRWSRSVLQRDPVGGQVDYASLTHNPLDLLEAFSFGLAQNGASEHRRLDGGVEPKECAAGFEATEKVFDAFGLSERLDCVR